MGNPSCAMPGAKAARATTREIADAHGVTIRTAQRWAKSGKLDAAKDKAGRWVIALEAPGLEDFKPEQVERARELIEQRGILPTSRPGMFTAVSSDGTTHYLVHASGCTCPAGQRGRHLCYHRAAVHLMTAARALRPAA